MEQKLRRRTSFESYQGKLYNEFRKFLTHLENTKVERGYFGIIVPTLENTLSS